MPILTEHQQLDAKLDQILAAQSALTSGLNAVLARLAQVQAQQAQLLTAVTTVNAAVTQLEINVEEELENLRLQVEASTAVGESGITLLNQLGDLMRAAADDPAAVRALADQVQANSNALAEAITANTAEPPVEEPTP